VSQKGHKFSAFGLNSCTTFFTTHCSWSQELGKQILILEKSLLLANLDNYSKKIILPKEEHLEISEK
jgi:hypothetical protein